MEVNSIITDYFMGFFTFIKSYNFYLGFEGEEDEETAKMEEEEARKIHQRMMSELENVDLDNELFIVNNSK